MRHEVLAALDVQAVKGSSKTMKNLSAREFLAMPSEEDADPFETHDWLDSLESDFSIGPAFMTIIGG